MTNTVFLYHLDDTSGIIWYHRVFCWYHAISGGIIYYAQAVPFVDIVGIIFCWYHFGIFFTQNDTNNLVSIKCYHF